MTESVWEWWRRRRFSTGRDVPYPPGTYRDEWHKHAALRRQFHADRNGGIRLSQIPLAADVFLVWVCAVGHEFVATPAEQLSRSRHGPGARAGCPVCSDAPRRQLRGFVPRPATASCGHHGSGAPSPDEPCTACDALARAGLSRAELAELAAPREREAILVESRREAAFDWVCPLGHGQFRRTIGQMAAGRRCRVCAHMDSGVAEVGEGEAFVSSRVPSGTSVSESRLRRGLETRFAVTHGTNAVRVRTAFFDRLEVWPDVLLPELRVAVEYDTNGRRGDEHVGAAEHSDRTKDRRLREVGWVVVRVRCPPLEPLGPHDVVGGPVTDALVDRVAQAIVVARGAAASARVRPRAPSDA